MKINLSSLLDLLFPRSQEVRVLEKLVRAGKLHELSSSPETPDPWIHSLFRYQDPKVRALVWEIKYRGNPLLISATSQLLYESLLGLVGEDQGLVARTWILIPVPPSKARLKEHGFSQTRKLAEAMMREDTHGLLIYKPHAIRKSRETVPQTTLQDRRKRLSNLSGAFSVLHAGEFIGTSVVLLDDVVTTGSTVREIKKVLREAGAHEVIALTVAH